MWSSLGNLHDDFDPHGIAQADIVRNAHTQASWPCAGMHRSAASLGDARQGIDGEVLAHVGFGRITPIDSGRIAHDDCGRIARVDSGRIAHVE